MPFSNLSRRDALHRLATFASGAALLPLLRSTAFAAEPTTSEPTGNPAFDKNLAAFESMPLVTTKLTDTLALLSGPGGNMAVLRGPDGALMVDTGVHPAAPKVSREAEAFAGKPVAVVIDTHWHFDHTGGNEFFGRHGARLVAQDNVRTRLGSDQFVEALGFNFPASPAPALPTVTFPDTLTMYFGGETIHLQHVAPAHTDGDVMVHFANANVLHMGDLFFNGIYPFIDYSSKGWIGGMVAAADHALTFCNEQTRVIPGHGPLATRADLKTTRDMLATVQSRLEILLDTGKDVEQIVATAPTRDLDERWGKGFFNGEAFTRNAAAGIMHHRQKPS